MNCDWVEKNIQLYVYDELADDARYELEQHVARCSDCAKELKSARGLHALMSRLPVQEPPPNLLAVSRMKLQDSLETAEQSGFWRRLVFDPWAGWREIRFAPALAAAILMVGFAGGIGGTSKVMKTIQQPITMLLFLQSSLRSAASALSLRTQAAIKSASNTTRYPARKRKARLTISVSSSCFCLPRATITTPAFAWIRLGCSVNS